MNVYIAFLCKDCGRWVSCSKRDFPEGLDKKEIVQKVRQFSGKCPSCKKSVKLYNNRINNYHSKFSVFVNADECTDFIKEKNGEDKDIGFFSYSGN